MKLLKGQTETAEKDGVKVEVKVIDTATQAILSELSTRDSLEGRIKMIGWMLRNVIDAVEIDGEKFNPKDIADRADISDKETMSSLMTIAALVIKVSFPSGDDEKN